MLSSSRIRVKNAPNSPSLRARGWSGAGSVARENRDEDDVVDAEDDLERRERQETDPGIRITEPTHDHSPKRNIRT